MMTAFSVLDELFLYLESDSLKSLSVLYPGTHSCCYCFIFITAFLSAERIYSIWTLESHLKCPNKLNLKCHLGWYFVMKCKGKVVWGHFIWNAVRRSWTDLWRWAVFRAVGVWKCSWDEGQSDSEKDSVKICHQTESLKGKSLLYSS